MRRNGFTRQELKGLQVKAQSAAEMKDVPKDWVGAYKKLADAAGAVDKLMEAEQKKWAEDAAKAKEKAQKDALAKARKAEAKPKKKSKEA